MENLRMNTALLSGLLLLAGCCDKGKSTVIADMRCEYMRSPIGIGTATPPRFTWTYTSDSGDEGFKQQNCRVRVASAKALLTDSSATADVWVSPEIVSQNSFVQYDAPAQLQPQTRYYWSVTAHDADGREFVSAVDSFETAMTDASTWTARWISDSRDKSFAPAPMLRKSFDAKEGVRDARLYTSAAAYGKVTLNGEPVSPDRLNPGYTHYDKRNLYSTYDVTGLLSSGENVLAAVLGNGFYNEEGKVATWDFEKARWRNRPRLICELHITYGDGTKQIVVSDGSWKTATGPYVQNNIYSGDTYDARLEIPGWDKPGFNDASWKAAAEVSAPSPLLTAQLTPAVQAVRELKPVNVKSFGDTVYLFDFGENIAGVCRLNIEGEKGTTLKIKHGELLKKDGRLETGNIDIYYYSLPGLEFQTDVYTLKGGGPETFTPDFNYHGFQFAEVKSDRPVKLTADNLTALFTHTAVEPVGSFSCSNDLLNRVWEATNRSYLGNLVSIPTDCPQREKNGWTADAHIAIDLALLNYDGIRFYEKWLDDFVDNQLPNGRISGIIPSSEWGYADWIGPVWDAAMFIIPEALYNYYGDTRGIEKIYPVCEKYLEYLKTREDSAGLVTYGIGDWVPYKKETPTDFTSSCFYYLDNKTMARFAEMTGRDGSAYAATAEKLKETINGKYFRADSALYANGSQAAQATALALGIVPEQYEQQVADNICRSIEASDGHLDFGMLGSKYVPRMLTKYGHADVVYEMAVQEDMPSWGNWLRLGLTTLAERFQFTPDNFRDASVNHVFLGDISAWMINSLAGINFDESSPGFRHIAIRPQFVDGLDWAKAEYRSVNGPIRSGWKRDGKKVILTVSIPVNTTATVYVGGKEKEVGAGTHEFNF